MLRFIKGSATILRLSENLADTLAKNVYICKEVFPQQIIVNTFHRKNILHSHNSSAFCTSTTHAPEIEAPSDEPNIAEICGGDPDLEHKLKVLILEMEVLRQEGKAIPNNSSMKSENWKELLNLSSKSARKKFLEFLFKVEKKKENKQKKKEFKRLEWERNPKPEKEDNVLNYDLGGNNIFLRFYDSTINHMYNNRLIQSMQFGQKLVVDCGYHENMTKRENSNCAKQLMFLFAENRSSDDPFDLHYCNVARESSLIKGLHKFIATMYEPWFPLNLHEKSYLDVFPKEQLVYLTPHCRDVLKEYDHNAVYIIGAIVDKVSNEPLSLAKAKKEGIRMAKLPLDYYLEWGAGSGKSLTVNQVMSILLDVKRTGDWNYAFRHVPRRKLADFQLQSAVKKFKSRLSYTSRIPDKRNSRWKPNSNTELDKLSFNRINKNAVKDEIENKSGTSPLLALKRTSNK
ncbi:hypothetical protein ILUMI_08376 [Ignelater luminosus]|uniref:RNA (guanine-9-)-methyltransferase domain-containing protein 1 n=1 Tax=Ignelater luminosus TaxID=2038154 RepID=A0A8K0D212_IGNLU|nr:hypothetical protein ILUMI_08376 [Ignelater luminosus]